MAIKGKAIPGKPALIRNIDEPGRNPFQVNGSITLGGSGGEFKIPIPKGKMVVFEHVSVSGALPHQQRVLVRLTCNMNLLDATAEAKINLVVFPQGPVVDGAQLYVASQPVKGYATEFAFVQVVISIPQPTPAPIWFVSAVGYLVPA